MKSQQCRLRYSMASLFDFVRTRERQQDLAVGEVDFETARRGVHAPFASPVPASLFTLVENVKGMVVDYVQEGETGLRMAEVPNERLHLLNLTVFERLKCVKD